MAGRKLGSKNKHRRITDVQLQKLVKDYNAGKGTEELAVPFGVTGSTISRWLKEAGVTLRAPGFRKGEDHHAWAGGKHLTEDGYVLAWVHQSDPLFCMAQKGHTGGGYVLEHRLKMARKLGRPLADSETVHHKDGNRQNNSLRNLQLRSGKHGKGSILCCADCGSKNIVGAPLS